MYQDWTHEQMRVALDCSVARVSDLTHCKRKLQQEVRRLRQRCEGLQLAACNDIDSDEEYTLLTVPEHKYRAPLSSHQMVAIGLRRNLSNVSSASFGLVTAQPISRQSVCVAEVFVGFQLRQRFQWWIADRCSEMQRDSDGRGLLVVSWGSDATNSAIWQRK